MNLGQPSLDQLRIFLAVADEGSFNAAARRLGRAISAISYGIAQIEAQLGLTLFEREGSRKPELTQAGRALLDAARTVTADMDALLAKARDHHQGLEAELTLAIDVMYPPAVLAALLKDFIQAFPTVDLRLHVEALGGVAAMLLENRADLGVTGPLSDAFPELDRTLIGSVELIPVAAPGHPLARLDPIPPGIARQHLQLVLSDRSPLTEGRDFSVTASRTWRLADLGAKHALLLEGIGWGNMPGPAIEADLAAGKLVRLALPEAPSVDYRFHALWRRDCPPGPARQWVRRALQERLCPPHPAP
ncbi:LysR family transcriptional regulator [Novosphingobium sp.]|uniref:LysR family transcriptional regulator n=1 Tax=Novosphingobium sp. TaxID=1874826 RepID=UPI0025D21624|nr:LysR family transcriptional regulator [Novosphingobium sp.]MCC6925510.1 LysR family transcriptional regulator [Novosphingobium sp.]